MRFPGGPSRLGNIFVAGGLLLLLALPAAYLWTDLQGAVLQARLGGPVSEAPTSLPLALYTPEAPLSSPRTSALRPASTAALNLTRSPGLPVIAPRSADAPTPSVPLVSPANVDTPAPDPTATPIPTAAPAPVGPPARIVFPDLHIDSGVSQMGWQESPAGDGSTEWSVPENTAGWPTTSAPLGVAGNIVLSGHNNIYGMVFRSISLAWPENRKLQLDPATYSTDILNGRLIQLYASDGRRFDYRVTGFYRLHDSGVPLEQRQANASYMQPTTDSELTLITCWPPWSNTYRLVVRARLISPAPRGQPLD